MPEQHYLQSPAAQIRQIRARKFDKAKPLSSSETKQYENAQFLDGQILCQFELAAGQVPPISENANGGFIIDCGSDGFVSAIGIENLDIKDDVVNHISSWRPGRGAYNMRGSGDFDVRIEIEVGKNGMRIVSFKYKPKTSRSETSTELASKTELNPAALKTAVIAGIPVVYPSEPFKLD